ncbi:ATP synthase c subunit lysine N-methyltransferase [Homo sapiens]|uniref:ATP synthase c subunit lysine N-methyltransferase n=1 Tax=Homo sapiens TaxID=9606 RepID=D6RIE0_HUMAN|nr:ATP synthase c subunit lysine N-methyltransferase [Homo sapiens]KAI4020784.1 ATP synthase c subunit lysine N-methyltransferase [Homo sapiens]
MEGGGGIPLETLKEESQSRHVLPASFEVNSLQKSNWGFLLTGLVGGTLVAVYAVATPFVTPALRKVCLPFVPATTKQIENVVKMLRCRRGSLVDIGSGDGRIVIFIAYYYLFTKPSSQTLSFHCCCASPLMERCSGFSAMFCSTSPGVG